MKLHKSEGVSTRNTLHYALGPFLVVANFLGVLPVSGVWPSANVADIRFRWRSMAVLHSGILIVIAGIDVLLSADDVLKHGFKLNTLGPMSFSTIYLVSFCVFLMLSRNWPELMKRTRRCEAVFLRPCYASPESMRLCRNIRILGIVLLCGALAEHLSYVGHALYNNHLQIKECNLTVNFWSNYFSRDRRLVFTIIQFHIWMSPLIEWITIAMTFAWNFIDILLILICRGMVVRIGQIRWRITQHSSQSMPSDIWLELRLDFMKLVELLMQYDAGMASLILLSCTNNLYFICVQVYYSFHNKGNIAQIVYFWCSFAFVMIRILTMLFSAAAVNEAATALSPILYEIPTDYWCTELKRLNEVVVWENIAFSGRGFFTLTRRLIFAMASTIVIYELVLLSRVEDVPTLTSICPTDQPQTQAAAGRS